jgi:hypothetical protein
MRVREERALDRWNERQTFKNVLLLTKNEGNQIQQNVGQTTEQESLLNRPPHREKYNIKQDLKEIGCEDID